MGASTDISGRFIKFTVNPDASGIANEVEFEIVSGNVQHQVDEQFYLPVGRKVKNVVTHGQMTTFTFQGVLLVKNYPWLYLTPDTEIYQVTVVLNRGGSEDGDELTYDEIEHYAPTCQIVSMNHVFDTGTHQVFDVSLVADGAYYPPGDTSYLT